MSFSWATNGDEPIDFLDGRHFIRWRSDMCLKLETPIDRLGVVLDRPFVLLLDIYIHCLRGVLQGVCGEVAILVEVQVPSYFQKHIWTT